MVDAATLLAVLIDADNISAKHAANIMDEITSHGEAGLRRVYGDWSAPSLSGWADAAQKLGLVQHQQAAHTKGKNATDIALVIDAMDILHDGHFDGFVLVSSDSDFTRLASRIREQGLSVIGIGEDKAPESFKKACNRFVSVSNIGADSSAVDNGLAAKNLSAPDAQRARQLIVNAMNKINPEADWFQLGRLGQQLQADRPDFDTRTYGYRKLSDLVKKLEGFEIRLDAGNNPEIRRPGK